MSATLVAVLLALTGCTAESGVDTTVSRAELESQVAALYPPKNERTVVTVACSGDLDAEVGATQDCHLDVDGDPADVRVRVTSVAGDRTEFEATPILTAERVAQTVMAALVEERFDVDSVECAAELVGIVGEQVTCRVAPVQGRGVVEVTVTAVTGLAVDFTYEVLDKS